VKVRSYSVMARLVLLDDKVQVCDAQIGISDGQLFKVLGKPSKFRDMVSGDPCSGEIQGAKGSGQEWEKHVYIRGRQKTVPARIKQEIEVDQIPGSRMVEEEIGDRGARQAVTL